MQSAFVSIAPILMVGVVAAAAQEIHRASVAIPNVIAAGVQVELIRHGFQGLEGPVATPDGGLFFSDSPTNRTYQLEKSGAISVWRENTNGANGLYLLADGRLLAAEGAGRRIVAITPDRRVTPMATVQNGQPFRAPNDLIPDRRGGVYFTDPSPRSAPGVAREPGNVHYLTPKWRSPCA